jgi:diguanylate cyclase (GGDEF)-like protein/PAS domain S-box-containing protein
MIDLLQFLPAPPDDSLIYAATYDPAWVVISVLLSIVASYAALNAVARAEQLHDRISKLIWELISALTLGIGVWSMHFIGMLALNLPCRISYDPLITLISMIPGILASWVALGVGWHHGTKRLSPLLGGILIGAGIGAMHYIGMAAMQIDGFVRYDPSLFALSIIVAIALAYLSLRVKNGVIHLNIRFNVLIAVIFGGAISGMHYTAMTAAYFVRGDADALPSTLFASTGLPTIIAIATVFLALGTLALAAISRNRQVTAYLNNQKFALDQHAIVSIADLKGNITYANDLFCKISGYSQAELIGQNHRIVNSGFHPPEVFSGLWRTISQGDVWHGELKNLNKDGGHYWVDATIVPLMGADGRPKQHIGIRTDISAIKQAEEEIRQLNTGLSQFKNTLDQTLEAVFMFDPESLRFTYVNQGAKRQTGYSQTELLQLTAVDITPQFTIEQFQQTIQPLIDGVQPSLTLQTLQSRKDGDDIPVEIFLQLIRLEGQAPCFVAMVSDISERQAAQKRIEFLAYHDVLTGLPNRLLAKDHLEQAILLAERENSKVALLFLDLDNFKTINVSLGHVIGDRLLKSVAVRLRECLRDIETLSRQGGDEFLIVLNNMRDTESVAVVAEKILERMAEPFEIDHHKLSISLSIGIAVYPDDGKDFETLLRQSDTALYHAKESGRNTHRFHTDQMNIDAVEHLRIRNGLRHALEHGEFVLHYQPQISLATGAIIGAEALIRWNHPELGMVPPGRFISVAEDSGLIVPIGDWVLREACRQAVAWHKAGLPELLIAVNLSAVQFKRGDVEKSVTQALELSGLNPALLELELTESILIKDTEKVLATVRTLKSLGVKLSIDDFGTGYSSLSYLKRFDVDKLKIDQSFVRDMVNDPSDAAIVRAIIQMAKSLNLTTIAEGVEDEHQLALLRLQHCDEAQGYHFARPMPADEFENFVLKSLLLPAKQCLQAEPGR